MELDSAGRAHVCLLVACGPPGAGKSSLAAALAAAARAAAGVRCSLVRFDDYARPPADAGAEDGAFDPARWKDGRAAALDRLAALLSECDAARPHLVVADDTMHLRSMRLQARRLARAAGAAAVVLHAACPLETALARNAARAPAERVPEAVARRLTAAFEAADAREGAAVVEVCTAGGVDAAEAWRRVRAAWGGPEPAPPDAGAEAARRRAARGATAASAAHAEDLESRRAVGAALARLAALPAPARTAAAAELAAARRRHLDALRAGGGDAQSAAFAAECEAAAARHLADY